MSAQVYTSVEELPRPNGKLKDRLKPLTCVWCEKDYVVTAWGGKRKGRKFCSTLCSREHYSTIKKSKLRIGLVIKHKRQAESIAPEMECANPECNNVFGMKQYDSKCCSKKCYMRKHSLDNPTRRHKKKNPCQWCGGAIESGSVNGIRNNRHKFCSDKCIELNRKDKAEKERLVRAKRNCKHCGVEFVSGIKGGKQECCSKECVDLERRNYERSNARRVKIKKLTGIGYEVDEAGLLAKKCDECGEDFKARRTIDCYCSKICLKNATISKRQDSDYYYRNLLSRSLTGEQGRYTMDVPVGFWSDDLVQAKKAEVRLRRAFHNNNNNNRKDE